MNAENLLAELKKYTSSQTVQMYIIERKLKYGAKSKDKPSEKFEYIPLKVNMSEDLYPKVSEMLSKVIDSKVKEDVQILEYSAIDDSEEKIQTYTDLGKIEGFKTFLENLGGEIKTIQSFKDVVELEKAWALCYGFEHPENNTWMYCIKKLRPSFLAIDKTLNETMGKAIKNTVNSYFDLDTKQLKPLKGFGINIEPSIDMIYFESTIYVFNKKGFEDVTSLTEEFIELGKKLVKEVDEIKFVSSGMKYISSLIEKKPSYRNKLIKAKEIGNLEFLKVCNVKTEFNRAGRKISFKFSYDSEGKIIANNEKEAEKIIEVLSEFYKEGVLGGKVFETAAGRMKK
jgi:hypothetical protein